ncbi:ribose ABC transporter ATP-binding protein (plasmid) [Paraburkholderia sp. PGU19]|uniref:sugar ABC transporter ATP-binding protein n=1 Tax=Paraburkholderia sp. PGU19 TaxID=2735434 RepID=UPI0015DA8BC9|nr:sugar ABC transporter ATP-binding protein [Paraburkholderia sp. PGU19]BCG04492.1 ribose ABC transporter ATP-binding protein [Paraburkholderia sp. PGU19]
MTLPIYEIRGLTKRFGRVTALDQVDLRLNANEVVGLIGQNGSGKSSLMKTMAGVQMADEGAMLLRGQEVRWRSTAEAARRGIGLVHQEQSLIPNLTVAENIFLDKSCSFFRHGWYCWKDLLAAARIQLDKIELDIRPDMLVERLGFAQRQMVELAKVLSLEEMVDDDLVIMFDEPTSMLSDPEIEDLFNQIRRIRHRASVVFISHRMDEVLELSDRVYVLSDGRQVAQRTKGHVDAQELYELMVGKQRSTVKRTATPNASDRREAVLWLDEVRIDGDVGPISVRVGVGEIVGLIGVQGSGAETLCRSLFGLEEVRSGVVSFEDEKVTIRSPADAIRRGIGYLPAERKKEGMLAGMSIADNMTLTFGFDYARAGVLADRAKEHAQAQRWVSRLKVKAPSLDENIERLSGGNQQKAVLGKWLMSRNLKLLIMDHPTRGLDPGARADLFETMGEMAADGLSILFVADTLDEVLLVSDTIVVMRDGQISATFENVASAAPAEETIVRAMV